MKKSTKILLIIFILTFIPQFFLGKYVISGISFANNNITFNFEVKAIISLIFAGINLVLGFILFFKFISSISFDKVLFFTSLPLVLIYGLLLFFIAYINSIDNDFARAIKSVLNITENNKYNLVLWTVVISLFFTSILFFNYFILCRPVSKVEKVVSRLGDGRVRQGSFNIGGGKQFAIIEHGLNKINNNYIEGNEEFGNDFSSRKGKLPKQFLRILGRGGVSDIEQGREVQKKVILMGIKLVKSQEFEKNSLDETFKIISSYFNLISPIVRKYGGYIDKYLGDGIVAVFGKNENALECEHNVCKAIEVKHKQHRLMPHILIRISLVEENVTFALTSINDRRVPAISSDLKLLEKVDEIGRFMSIKVVFSKSILDNLPLNYRFKYRYVGCINNLNKNVLLFEDLEVYSKETKDKLFRTKSCFEKAVMEYEKENYNNSLTLFEQALKGFSSDNASYIYYNKTKEKLQ